MVNVIKIRPSKEFRDLLNWIRAKNITEKNKTISISEITKIIAQKIDKEQLWIDEFK